MKADPEAQRRLLDLQALDTGLAQLAHRRRTLPEHAQLAELRSRLAEVADELVVARAAASDVARELAKAEADVEQVRSRAARDRQRLDAGQGSAKDLSAMQHEIQTLAARQSVLEDVELEVMERQEAAEAAVEAITAEQQRLAGEVDALQQKLDARLAEIDAEAESERLARDGAASGVPGALLTLYERLRENHGGVGAARLYQRRCEGCRMEMPASELGKLRAAADDEVIRCDECGRILVRTAESGL